MCVNSCALVVLIFLVIFYEIDLYLWIASIREVYPIGDGLNRSFITFWTKIELYLVVDLFSFVLVFISFIRMVWSL